MDQELLNKVSELEKSLEQLLESNNKVVWLDSADIKQRFHISDTTLWRWRKKGKIPFNKIGDKYVYPESFFSVSMMKTIKNSHLLQTRSLGQVLFLLHLYPPILPSFHPSILPSFHPSILLSFYPSILLSFHPSIFKSFHPSIFPSFHPTSLPSLFLLYSQKAPVRANALQPFRNQLRTNYE